MFKVERDRAAFLDALRARNVLMVEYPYGQIRAVTHYGIGADDIDSALEAVEAALAETSSGATPGRRPRLSHRPVPPTPPEPAGRAAEARPSRRNS